MNIALFVHVLGAMVLVGALVTSVGASLVGWSDESPRLRRLGYWTLLAVALPGYVVMRVGAEWTFIKSPYDDLPEGEEPGWIGIGYITADLGLLLMLIALIVGGIGLRKTRSGGGGGLLKASSVIAVVLLAAYVVAVWAMGGKPD